MHWYYGSPMGWGDILGMALGMIVFWGTLGVVGIMLIRNAGKVVRGGSAQRILEERLAKGEIDTDEFDRVRKTLSTR